MFVLFDESFTDVFDGSCLEIIEVQEEEKKMRIIMGVG